MGKVDLSVIFSGGIISFPKIMPYAPEFNPGAIFSVAIIFLVSAAETIGDTTAMVSGGLDRDITTEEISGSLACDGYASAFSSCLGCPPVTSFSQNVGLINMTKVVNRVVLGLAAVIIVLVGLIPKFSALLTTVPSCVLGGATVSVFAMIAMTGIKLVVKGGLNTRNTAVVGLSVALGIGVIQVADCFAQFPEWAKTIFGTSPVVIATLTAVTLNLLLPKDLD